MRNIVYTLLLVVSLNAYAQSRSSGSGSSGSSGSGLPDMTGNSGKVLTNNGSAASWTSNYANNTLSNISSTNIPVPLINDGGGESIGSAGTPWATGFFGAINPGTAPASLAISTSNNASGNSGDVTLTVGTASGTQGAIKLFKTGVASVVGQIFTASAVDGTGYWATPAPLLNQVASAAATVTWANGANPIAMSADTIGSGIAFGITSSHTTMSGNLLKLQNTGNNASVTGAILLVDASGANAKATNISVTSNSTDAAARGAVINMSGAGSQANIGLNVTTVSTGGTAATFARTGTGGTSDMVVVNEASTANATAFRANATGATGNQAAIAGVASSSGSVVGISALATSASNTGTALNAGNSSTSASSSTLDASTSRAAADVGFRLYNKATAGANNGFAIRFFANQTGTADKEIARVLALITDVTSSSADSAIAFQTVFNDTLAERLRLNNAGHLVYGTASTAPTITANCGTSPSIAGVDGAGRLTVGTGGSDTACTVTFGVAWATAPSCQCNDETTALLLKCTASTTTLIFTSATPLGAADKLTYQCVGY